MQHWLKIMHRFRGSEQREVGDPHRLGAVREPLMWPAHEAGNLGVPSVAVGRTVRVAPVRRILGVAAALVAALPAADASAAIVPQRGMLGVTLGMTVAQVRERLGAPDRVIFVDNDVIGRQRIYRYGLTSVVFDGAARTARVLSLSTTSRLERLVNGVGVGSTRGTVARRVPGVRCRLEHGIDHCYVGRFEPGRRVTDFLIGRRGRVTRITVGRVVD